MALFLYTERMNIVIYIYLLRLMIASFLTLLNLSPIPKPADLLFLVVGISYDILSIVFRTFGNLSSYPKLHFNLDGDEDI